MNLNSVPKREYWTCPEWSVHLENMGLPHTYHRRFWEWGQVAYGLDSLGLLQEESRGLGVGVGNEPLIFYLAARAGEIVASDMYGKTWAKDGQADRSMLTEPERFSPIPFPKERLRVARMNAMHLEFADESFDFVWSVGAIEHFGSSLPKHGFRLLCRSVGLRRLATRFDHRGAAKAATEMGRVLKKGGVAAITTELILNGKPHHEFFLPEEIGKFLIEPSRMVLVGNDLDISPSAFFAEHVLAKERWTTGDLPHVVLRDQNGVVFTSVSLFLRKPGDGTPS